VTDPRTIMRRRSLVALASAGLVALIVVAVAALASSGARSGNGRHPPRSAPRAGRASAAQVHDRASPGATVQAATGPPYPVGIIHLRLVDRTRTLTIPGGGTAPRTLLTSIRYPAVGAPTSGEHVDATPAAGPFPLIVFGHGFAVTVGIYSKLLDAWAADGYVVAAPTFPLGNANAPGGPNEQDLPNQAGDMSFVITRMLAADLAPGARLHGLIESHEIAVAGQSDGGDTALAVAYDSRDRDPRVSAAVILSGAEDPFVSSFSIAPGGPPLLATQGTADPINLPSATAAFYDPAPPPKYLLKLPGAGHLPPYTNGQPQLGIVERVTLAFLDEYLKHKPGAARRLTHAGDVPGLAILSAEP
jgi:dienelactone hydrolase